MLLHRQWAKKGLFALLLSPFSFVFLCVSRYRAMHAQPERLPVPVVVVGNIYVGGTGKTPVTIALARGLRKMGWHPGVISRGYGRKADGVKLVGPNTDSSSSGDEPLLIARKTGLPVAVGRDRVEAGRLLLKSSPEIDIIISDDGLQHYALRRDVELCVIGAHGIGNGWVPPAGPLREPPSRLDSVDAIVLNATSAILETRTPRFAASSTLGRCTQLSTGKELTLEALRGQLEGKTFELGDHFSFESNPFKDLDADCILITEKDAVKCRQIREIASDPRIWVAGYDIVIEDYLLELVDQKARRVKSRMEKGKP